MINGTAENTVFLTPELIAQNAKQCVEVLAYNSSTLFNHYNHPAPLYLFHYWKSKPYINYARYSHRQQFTVCCTAAEFMY